MGAVGLGCYLLGPVLYIDKVERSVHNKTNRLFSPEVEAFDGYRA